MEVIMASKATQALMIYIPLCCVRGVFKFCARLMMQKWLSDLRRRHYHDAHPVGNGNSELTQLVLRSRSSFYVLGGIREPRCFSDLEHIK